ncbi:hypothetical protein ABT173_11080 [Streptomyces sp. NPDC001795]|uniref:hypothetical protein n=1 Tax=unclassified Streptomyces TaxID=2593676 RepID=UPI0033273CA9
MRACATHADALPWSWSSTPADEWFGDLRAVRGCVRSTLRGYQEAVRLFCDYAADPAYGWAAECERRFGTCPIQVCHEWKTAEHMLEREAATPKARRSVSTASATSATARQGNTRRSFTRGRQFQTPTRQRQALGTAEGPADVMRTWAGRLLFPVCRRVPAGLTGS